MAADDGHNGAEPRAADDGSPAGVSGTSAVSAEVTGSSERDGSSPAHDAGQAKLESSGTDDSGDSRDEEGCMESQPEAEAEEGMAEEESAAEPGEGADEAEGAEAQGEVDAEAEAEAASAGDTASDDDVEEIEGPTPEEEGRRQERVSAGYISLEAVDDQDRTFRMQAEGELSRLATDIARLGQLFPVDVREKSPGRYQIVCGFRRIAALHFLQRDRVFARVHRDLRDEDALLMALAAAVHATPIAKEELESLRERLEAEGRLTAAIRDMLEKAVAGTVQDLAPESVEQEVDADELAIDVTMRLGNINQDLSMLADVFGALDEERKAELIKQLRYSADLVAFLEGL